MNNERLAELSAVKLRGLVSEHLEAAVPEASRLGSGASLLAHDEGWMYFPHVTPGLLGTAVIWGLANTCHRMNLIVDDDAGQLAHAAQMFREPLPVVWVAQGRSINPAVPAAPHIPPPPECLELTADLSSAGLEVVADHAVWLGEINGLEVARVGIRGGTCEIDVGVGAYDQFASAGLHRDLDRVEELAHVAAMVRPHRIAGAPPHPMGRIVRSRWLRAQLVREPSLIGLDSIDPIPLLRERPGLMETQPAAALGYRGASRVLVVCTVGVDLGIVETAAGLAALHGLAPNEEEVDEIVVVCPSRDRHQRVVDSVASLALPSSVVAVEGEWSD